MERGGGFSKMAVVGIEYVTLAIKVGLLFSFAVIFSLTYFLFRRIQKNH
jgi:hypothetical protein